MGLNTDSKLALLFNSVFTLRRLLFSLVCVFLIDYPFLQIQSLTLQSLFFMMYLTIAKPLETSFDNNVELFNEITIITASYHLYGLTNFLADSKQQYNIGDSLIAITLINIGVNILIVIYQNMSAIARLFKCLFRKCKSRNNKVRKSFKPEESMFQGEEILTEEAILKYNQTSLDEFNSLKFLSYKKQSVMKKYAKAIQGYIFKHNFENQNITKVSENQFSNRDPLESAKALFQASQRDLRETQDIPNKDNLQINSIEDDMNNYRGMNTQDKGCIQIIQSNQMLKEKTIQFLDDQRDNQYTDFSKSQTIVIPNQQKLFAFNQSDHYIRRKKAVNNYVKEQQKK